MNPWLFYYYDNKDRINEAAKGKPGEHLKIALKQFEALGKEEQR